MAEAKEFPDSKVDQPQTIKIERTLTAASSAGWTKQLCSEIQQQDNFLADPLAQTRSRHDEIVAEIQGGSVARNRLLTAYLRNLNDGQLIYFKRSLPMQKTEKTGRKERIPNYTYGTLMRNVHY